MVALPPTLFNFGLNDDDADEDDPNGPKQRARISQLTINPWLLGLSSLNMRSAMESREVGSTTGKSRNYGTKAWERQDLLMRRLKTEDEDRFTFAL